MRLNIFKMLSSNCYILLPACPVLQFQFLMELSRSRRSTCKRIAEGSLMKEPFPVLLREVTTTSVPEGHGHGELESSKFSSKKPLNNYQKSQFQENITSAKFVIPKEGKQRNKYSGPFSSHSPISCHVSHWLNPIKTRGQESLVHTVHKVQLPRAQSTLDMWTW